MSEMSKFEEQKKKLDGLCEEHNLTYRLRCNTYPMTLTLRPLNGMYEQMDMLASVEDKGYISPDAFLQFAMKDGKVSHHINGTFTIEDDLFMKFKGIFKKLNLFFTQYFFREVIENNLLRRGQMPVIDEDLADDPAEEDTAPEIEEAEEDDEEEDEYEYADEDEDMENSDEDALIREATSIVRAENKATTSLLQRRLHVSYSQAYHIMEVLEKQGVVGPLNDGGTMREVLPFDVPDDEAE